ncbi:hypothetical protein HY972_01300 [Candidatus Kaiserbacteria bacterium]|nr:hypothetical protein [Candidatus Kaiserbacteria bacterium]
MKKREFKKLPEGMTLGQMEEIFADRLANLIVMLLDHQHEQKLKAENNEKKAESKI